MMPDVLPVGVKLEIDWRKRSVPPGWMSVVALSTTPLL